MPRSGDKVGMGTYLTRGRKVDVTANDVSSVSGKILIGQLVFSPGHHGLLHLRLHIDADLVGVRFMQS